MISAELVIGDFVMAFGFARREPELDHDHEEEREFVALGFAATDRADPAPDPVFKGHYYDE